MIRYLPKEAQIKLAKQKSEEMGELNNSIREGRGNVYGFLGEIIVADVIDGIVQNTYDYDVVKDDLKIDVKTKRCTSEPLPNYFCSVAAYNTKQKCDVYVFVRILEDFSVAWILGGILKDEFYQKATFNRAGELDTSSTFGWTFKADCYNLKISGLHSVKIV